MEIGEDCDPDRFGGKPHLTFALRFPDWEEMGYTPVVFVRVANKGVRVYVIWKSA